MLFKFTSFHDENLKQNIINSQTEIFKNAIEEKDWEIFNSQWRKDKSYIPHSIASRTIITKYGIVTFKRHRYKYWLNGKWRYICLVDKEYDIKRYQRVHDSLKFRVLTKISTGATQTIINDIFSNAQMHIKSICNIINSFDLKILSDPCSYNVQKITIGKCLYINVDDFLPTLVVNNKLRKCRVRIAVFHTGYVNDFANRKELANKKFYAEIVTSGTKIDTRKFVNRALNFAHNFYNNVDSSFKIIGGDSATWIKNLPTYVNNSIYITDKFHAIRDLKTLKLNNKECIDLFCKGNYKELMLKINEKYSTIQNKTKLQKTAYSTLKNNEIGITNQKHPLNIGTFAESNISILKSLFGYGAKSFNLRTYQNMLTLRLANINGLNIIELLKNRTIH
ncbi:Mbov_0401 family ICE element transposase-like protein [Spiroplasma endosymbiont of Colias croceus]|uniref:Mbov_0401 family ICE element transposase-like protein n=1 Tax=Spiroplasma endosymbiont of Colias croceus TaxID=3066310 RepID=UPI0030CC1877